MIWPKSERPSDAREAAKYEACPPISIAQWAIELHFREASQKSKSSEVVANISSAEVYDNLLWNNQALPPETAREEIEASHRCGSICSSIAKTRKPESNNASLNNGEAYLSAPLTIVEKASDKPEISINHRKYVCLDDIIMKKLALANGINPQSKAMRNEGNDTQ